MAKKKGAGRGDDEDDQDVVEAGAAPQPAGGKNKKKGKRGKGRDDFDDDFKVEPEEGETVEDNDQEEHTGRNGNGAGAKAAAGGKKKKGKKGRGDDDSDDEVSAPVNEEELDSKPAQASKKGKKGKKGRADDEFDEEFKVDEDDDASEVAASTGGPASKVRGKKKDKKKGRRAGDWSDEEEDEAPAAKKVVPVAKGKAGSKKAASTFALLNLEDEDSEDGEVPKAVTNGKAKAGSAKKAVSFAALEDDDDEEEEEEEAPKPSKKLNGFAGLSLEDADEQGEAGPVPLVVGEIESVEKIKKADKLRLCYVDVGEDEPLQIVCGGKNVREGLKVVVARVGTTIPSNGMAIKKTTIKGVDSFGMICGAGELGWEGPADEAVELAAESVIGEAAPLTRPSEEEEEEEAVFAGKKKSKKGAMRAAAQDSEEEEPAVFTGKKKKKGVKAEGGDDSKVEASKKKGEADGDVNVEESLDLGGKKKKKGKKQDEFDKDFEVEPEEEESEPVVFAGKKKKGKKDKDDDFDKEFEVDAGEAAEEEAVVFAGKKKKKGKKETHDDFDKDFEMEKSSGAPAEDESEALVFGGKKKKKGKKAAHDDCDKDFETEESVSEAPAPAEPAVERKGKKGKGKKEDEDIEALLAQLEAPKDEDEGGGSKKKKKKGKKGKDEKEEEDIDALLAELEGPKKVEPQSMPSTAPAAAEPEPSFSEGGKESTAEVAAADGDEKEGDEGLSAAAKKKKKKKEKEKEKKAAAIEDEAPKEEDAKKKKAAADKKLPLHVRQMQERLAKLAAEEERKKKEEEEKRRLEEEEAARLAELEQQKEEAKLRKKQKEKEKKEQLKKEGKLLTGKQKEEAKRLAAVREQMLKQAGVKLDDEEGPPKKQKVVYGTKRDRRAPKQAADAVPKELSPEPEPAAEPEPMEEETLEPEPVKEDAPALPEVEAAEAPAEVEEEEDEEDDWDAKSWDEAEVDKTLKRTGAFKDEEPDVPARVASPKPAKKDESKSDEPAKTPKPSASRPAILHKAGPRKQPADDSSSEDGDSDSESEDESSEDEFAEKRKADARKRREARMEEAMAKRDENDLRSPICCILGHVDTGKTKLLDRIRNTNVQEGEAGGITQQIGATFFPMEAIKERTKELKADAALKVPGLLIIDTPGHESFTNLRSRGSGLCDIAILVVDIMHGLEPQTVESINLLKMRKTPFIIALNKVDRLYDWKVQANAPIRTALKNQPEHVRTEFDRRAAEAIAMLQEQGLNSALYWKNNDLRKVISIVPTSAISGEGIPDMLLLLVQMTQKMMTEKLMYLSETQCTVLEVKVIEGLGTTIDVVLVNGVLHEGDTIVVCGMQGAIKTTIRALLTPHPMKELRVKGSYVHHKELKAAQGIKITAQGLETAVAGTQLHVVGPDDDPADIMEEAMKDMKNVLSRVDKSGEGVCVQASTLGSLEALLEFLKSPEVNIPVSGIAIGPVHKKDVMRSSVMLERKRKEFACILAFDVQVTTAARELAEELGVKVFTADIIYHLFDQFTAYMSNIKLEKRADAAEDAVFPCILKILPQFVFMKKDPIILGCDVVAGIAKIGTPICVPTKGNIDIGKIASIEMNHKAVDTAKKGQSIALKIQSTNAEEAQKMFGRHFDKDDELVSHISRKSIDLLKENYRDDLTREDWMLVVKLKKMFEIQ